MRVMEETSGRDLKGFFQQWLSVPGQPVLKISTSAGEKKGSMNIVIEQIQDNIFSFSIEMLLSDSGGTRKITIPVKERVTRKIVDSGPDLKVTPDPDVKLLFRQVM